MKGKMMKLLEINVVCGIKSTGRIATDIAEKYKSLGWETKIAYGRECVLPQHKAYSIRIGNEKTALVNAIVCRFLDNDGFGAKSQTANFLQWAENYNPDILWLHNLPGYYINVEMLFRWIKSRPNMKVYWTLHDCWSFTGHCTNFDYIKCDKWRNGCEHCPQKTRFPASYVMDCSKKNYLRKKEAFTGVKDLTIITPSNWLANLVRSSFLAEYRISVVNNKIDTSTFKPTPSDFREKYGLEKKIVVLGVATGWGKMKGLYDFFELSAKLDEAFKVVLVGLNDNQLKKCPKNILAFKCTHSKEELAQIYTAADVFLNLTYEDNYPTVNLEAEACGTQCWTYRTGGSVESVLPENIIEQGDLDEVLCRLESLKHGRW